VINVRVSAPFDGFPRRHVLRLSSQGDERSRACSRPIELRRPTIRIKSMTPAMIAALFPPKPKPEEAWRNDYPAELADLPPPAPPEPQPEAQRVSLVDILREQHAKEQRAAALNPIRLGPTQQPDGLFGIRAGPAPVDMEESRFGVRSSGLSTPPTGFNLRQPLRADPLRAAPSSIEPSSFTQPNFGNFRQDERPRYPDDFPPFDVPPFGFPSSRRDQFPWVLHAHAPAGNGIESDRDRDHASDPAPTQPPSSGPAPAAPDRPQRIGAPLPATGSQIAGSNEILTGRAPPTTRHNIASRQPQNGSAAANSATPALPKFGAGPTFGFARIPAWLMTYPNYDDLQLVADRNNAALRAPDGSIYVAPPGVTNEYLLGALNHLSDVAKTGGPFAVEKEFRRMYTDPHNPHFIDFKVFGTSKGPDWARKATPTARVTYRSSATGQFVTASPYEAFGNFFYGFAGRSANISPEELRAVAGLVQQGRDTVYKVVHGLPDNPEDVPHVSAGMHTYEKYRAEPKPMFGVTPMPPRPTGPELRRFNR